MQVINYGKKFLLLRAKTKANLKPELQMKVAWKTCERELGKMNSVNENYYKKLIWTFLKAASYHLKKIMSQPTIAFSEVSIEILEQGVKYVQS